MKITNILTITLLVTFLASCGWIWRKSNQLGDMMPVYNKSQRCHESVYCTTRDYQERDMKQNGSEVPPDFNNNQPQFDPTSSPQSNFMMQYPQQQYQQAMPYNQVQPYDKLPYQATNNNSLNYQPSY